MSNVVINLNFGPRMVSVPVAETRQRALEIEPENYRLEPDYGPFRYLIYEGLTPLDIFQYRESSQGKGKAGKQCKTGQACGNTCISKTKTCKNGLSGAQQQKAKTAKAKTTAKGKDSESSLPKIVKKFNGPKFNGFFNLPGENTRVSQESIPKDSGRGKIKVATTFQEKDIFSAVDSRSGKILKNDIPALEIAFGVDGSVDYSKKRLSQKEKVKIGLNAFKMIREDVKKLPDGTLLINQPYAGDGKQDYRARIYRKAGFGEMNQSGFQFAIVQGGKLKPLTEKELQEKIEAEY